MKAAILAVAVEVLAGLVRSLSAEQGQLLACSLFWLPVWLPISVPEWLEASREG